MDSESRAQLNRILSVEPAALSEADKEFLRARRSYLNKAQLEDYAEVLESPKPAKPEKPEKPAKPEDKE